jgi:hypothetical protein
MKINLVVIGMILLVIVFLIVIGSKAIKKHQKYDSIPTKTKFELIRTGDKEQDNKLTATHIESGDTLSLLIKDNNVYFDKNSDGTNNILMKDENGKLSPVYDISLHKTKYLIDTDLDIGMYVGYIGGSKISNESNNFDYGVRFSPFRIGEYVAPDLLLSPKATGIGLSVYPFVNSDYKILSHVGLGYGKVFTFQDNFSERNLFFISTSFKF